MKSRLILAAFLVLLSPAFVAGQPPKNPNQIEFEHPDYALTTEYEVGFFNVGAPAPVATQSIGKPPLAAGKIVASLPWRPLSTLGVYEIRVRAKVGTTLGPWGAGGADGTVPVPFERALASPVALRTLP